MNLELEAQPSFIPFLALIFLSNGGKNSLLIGTMNVIDLFI